LPTVEELVATNNAFMLLEEERRHPDRRPADPRVPPEGGDPSLDWEALRAADDGFAKWAMEKYGRVGRDPERIGPFLARVGEAWGRHPELRFGQLAIEVVRSRRADYPMAGPEEDEFLKLLGAWEMRVAAAGNGVSRLGDPSKRDPARIELLLDRIGVCWRAHPDMRFGQLVSNIVLFRPGENVIRDADRERYPRSLLMIKDEKYLRLVEAHIDADAR
jgi:hypothetical protein